jgi:two-component system, NtrC family, response regulator AtoC
MITSPADSRSSRLPATRSIRPAGASRPALVVVEAPQESARALPAGWPRAAQDAARPLQVEPAAFGSMVGTSAPMLDVFDQISRVAPTDAAVLVLGESGTGKELVAEAVHALSRRSDKPMISINCGAISATLIESELFGHERGSFTGAGRVHRGHFERADGGTLFLDEINEMPYELQVKLLRVLESGTFFRVGGDRPISASVRIIAASKPDLERIAAEGRFRADLLYRLKVFPITLPPLRDRRGDLALLVEHFFAELNARSEVAKRLTPAALALLDIYDWPGNIRELKHLLERAFILADGEIGPAELSGMAPRSAGAANVAATPRGCVTLEPGLSLADAERLYVLATLGRAGGNRARTAAMLEISTKALRCRLRRYQNQTRLGVEGLGAEAKRCFDS